MASNPMQRKARISALLGVFGTLIVTGAIIALLFMQLSELQKKEKERTAKLRDVYVASSDIRSGESIESKLKMKSVDSDVIPTNALTIDITKETIAKIAIKANTILTNDMVQDSKNPTTNDLRKQEYNMVILPTQIQDGDYIDIRLKLSNGVDYIVASRKQVTIPTINGVESANTVILSMNESEILVMGNAIIDAYIDKGSLLYATTYVEPGMQETAIPTYVPTGLVQDAIARNPNIQNEAKNELINRYNQNTSTRTNSIEVTLANYAQERVDNIEAGVQEQITKAKQERQNYLESLGGY